MIQTNRIAIITDWLIDFWWAELVLSHLLEMFPDADIYTSVCYMKHPMLEWRNVYTSWLQRIPFFNRRHKLAGILRPFAFRSLDLSGYDMVICSSSAESKQVTCGKWRDGGMAGWRDRFRRVFSRATPPLHHSTTPPIFVYCHTPIRYYWSHYEEYRSMMEFGWLNPIARFTLDTLVGWLRKLDYAAAQKVDYFIANSRTTQERIKQYYQRESEVIYPGVSIPLWGGTQGGLVSEKNEEVSPPTPPYRGASKEWYYFGMSRCIPYKRLDLLVEAFNTNGKQLILATNTDNLLYRELREKSKDNITWVFNPPKEEKSKLYAEAKAFLFPPEEDFGLVPVEAMMSGTPVIAYGRWGGTESVVDGETGLFFAPQTPAALNEAIEKFEKVEWDKEKIQIRGMEFSKERFQEKIKQFIAAHD